MRRRPFFEALKARSQASHHLVAVPAKSTGTTSPTSPAGRCRQQGSGCSCNTNHDHQRTLMRNKTTAVVQWIRREAGPLLVASIFPLLLIVYFFKEGFSIKVLALFLALPLVVFCRKMLRLKYNCQ